MLLNLAYTLRLKQLPLFDVCVIAIGFVLRLFIGSMATGISLSSWIVITTFFLSLFLAFAKRRDDVAIFESSGIQMRKSLEGYNLKFLDLCIGICATMSVFSYVMWSISESAIWRLHSEYLYLTSLFVVLGIMRYLQLIYVYSQGGSPTEIVLKDRAIHFVIIFWILSFILIYFIFGGKNA